MLGRHARSVELSSQVAKQAERLWGDNSLVVADMHVSKAAALRSLARMATSSSEKEVLRRRAWASLALLHALLLRRLADNTLLPGTVKEEEVTYHARSQAFACKAADVPIPSEAVLQALGTLSGYVTLLDAVYYTLGLLMELRRSALPRESAHSLF